MMLAVSVCDGRKAGHRAALYCKKLFFLYFFLKKHASRQSGKLFGIKHDSCIPFGIVHATAVRNTVSLSCSFTGEQDARMRKEQERIWPRQS
jgi:hypothetical protein